MQLNKASTYPLPVLPKRFHWSVKDYYRSGVYSRGSKVRIQIRHDFRFIFKYSLPAWGVFPVVVAPNENVVKEAAKALFEEFTEIQILLALKKESKENNRT
jgi:hypothetical protein